MAAAQQGDATAYEALLVSLVPILRAFVRRRGVDEADVEDVVQEVLILIHRARHTWRPDRPFDPWMWSIARNATTDALRRQTRMRRRTQDGQGSIRAHARSPLDETASSAEDPEGLLASAELSPRLTTALAALPDAQRQAIDLLYVQQLPVADAAARAGVSQTALKVRAHRGSRALRSILERKDPK